ncbi:MAG: peptidylprolyl isomerase [Tenuifilaceae bacterium]
MKMMIKTTKNAFFLLLFSFAIISSVRSQTVIDHIIGVVGGDMILSSDIEHEIMRMKMQGNLPEGDIKCQLFENLLVQKLLLHQAKVDSIPPNYGAVESEIDRRLKYFINQIGSEEGLENYFKKNIFEIKEDLRDVISEQMLTQQMQQKIIEKITVTPSEIKSFYRTIKEDSLPVLPEQYELQQIAIYPPSTAEAKFRVKERLLELRSRVLKGERFSMLAVAYSEDLASAKKGGELGFRSKDELVKAFADVAFNLADGQVSQIVETEYGFHIIQMIEKRNNMVNVRHILLKPQYTTDMLIEAQAKLDSVVGLIKADSITFERACIRFSQDKKSNLNGGLVINPNTNTSFFEKEQLQPSDYYVIKELKKGEVSSPFESRDEHANVIFKVVKLKSIIPSHKANLKDDYNIIQQMTKQSKEQDLLMKWVEEKRKTTYIKIDPSYIGCKFESDGWVK